MQVPEDLGREAAEMSELLQPAVDTITPEVVFRAR